MPLHDTERRKIAQQAPSQLLEGAVADPPLTDGGFLRVEIAGAPDSVQECPWSSPPTTDEPQPGQAVSVQESDGGNFWAVWWPPTRGVATGDGDVGWDEVTGKPATFPPDAHDHPLGDVQRSGAADKQSIRWDNVGGAWVPVFLDGASFDPSIKDGLAATVSLRSLGPGAQQAAPGNDARLSNPRAPTAHASTHQPGGSDAMAVDAAAATGSLRTLGTGSAQAAAGNHTHTGLTADQAAGTASIRTLGTGALQAAAGNDSRFTNARTPTAHATSHQPGGTDALAVDAAAATGSLRTLGVGAQQAASGTDSRFTNARTPTAHASTHQPGGADAMAADAAAATASLRTLGAGAQQAAAGDDARFTNARTPTAHASTHQPGGSDAMAVDAAAATASLRTLGTGANQAMPGDATVAVADGSVGWAKTGAGAAGLAQYAFSARRNATSTTLAGAVTNMLGCTTEDFDIGGAYDAANGEYVTPVAGIYFFEVHLVWTNAPSQTRYRLILYDDSSAPGPALGTLREITLFRNWNAGTEDLRLVGSAHLSLPAAARLEPRVIGIDAACSGQIFGSTGYEATRWSGHLVGKT